MLAVASWNTSIEDVASICDSEVTKSLGMMGSFKNAVSSRFLANFSNASQ